MFRQKKYVGEFSVLDHLFFLTHQKYNWHYKNMYFNNLVEFQKSRISQIIMSWNCIFQSPFPFVLMCCWCQPETCDPSVSIPLSIKFIHSLIHSSSCRILTFFLNFQLQKLHQEFILKTLPQWTLYAYLEIHWSMFISVSLACCKILVTFLLYFMFLILLLYGFLQFYQKFYQELTS